MSGLAGNMSMLAPMRQTDRKKAVVKELQCSDSHQGNTVHAMCACGNSWVSPDTSVHENLGL